MYTSILTQGVAECEYEDKDKIHEDEDGTNDEEYDKEDEDMNDCVDGNQGDNRDDNQHEANS